MNDDLLSNASVAAMHDNITAALDADIRRRTRRARLVAGAAAVAVVVAVGGVGLSMLTGGSPQVGISASSDKAGDSAVSGGQGESSLVERPGEDVVGERELITTGSITIAVSDPAASARKISGLIESLGGRIDERTMSTEGGKDIGSATLVVRVPGTKMTGVLDRLEAYGDVEDVSVQAQDVTSQGQDLDARIQALQISVDRLQAIMRDADSSKELLDAEKALSGRQADLDSLVAQRKGLSERVELSTLTINLHAADEAQRVEADGFKGGLVKGWNALAGTLEAAVVLVGVLLPWLALLTAIVAIYVVVRRLRRR